jgi:alpha-1,2-mannosyltransferase
LAYSYALRPASLDEQGTRCARLATFWFAVGAIVGWPFSALLAVPFGVEQVFVRAGDVVESEGEALTAWWVKRVGRLVSAGLMGLIVVLPVVLVDSWAYGRWTFPNLNIVRYNLHNLFSPADAAAAGGPGPDLYGEEPPSFYILNLLLNFNLLLVLALAAIPALAITYAYDFRRLGVTQRKPTSAESSPYTLVALRLTGFYLWLAVFSVQKHKEERFMFPAYGLLCLNAGVTVFLVKGWAETAFVRITSSSYRVSEGGGVRAVGCC